MDIFRIVVGVLLLALLPHTAEAETAPVVDLYTVGPGDDAFSKYGHSALCIADEKRPQGVCYDYGVADTPDARALVWGTLRGQPHFVPISVPLPILLSTFESQERSVWKQRLPFDAAHVKAMSAALEHDVESKTPYSYDPESENCATKIRDQIDTAANGKLQNFPAPTYTPTFREIMEAGFSGQPLTLAGVALFVGWPGEMQPTSWQLMFLPEKLRDAVAMRLGANADLVYAQRGYVMQTSSSAGRALLVVLGAALGGLVFYGTRGGEKKFRVCLAVVGAVLGLVALAVDFVAAVTVFPWLTWNLLCLVFLPTDLALGFLRGTRLRHYLSARVGLIGLAAVLSMIGFGHQPIFSAASLAALPFAAALLIPLRQTAKNVQPKKFATT